MRRVVRRTTAVLAAAAAVATGAVAAGAPASASTHPSPRIGITKYWKEIDTCHSDDPCNLSATYAPAYRVYGDRLNGRSAYVALVSEDGDTIETWKVATKPVSGRRGFSLYSGYYQCQGQQSDAWFGVYDPVIKKWSVKAHVAVMCEENGFDH